MVQRILFVFAEILFQFVILGWINHEERRKHIITKCACIILAVSSVVCFQTSAYREFIYDILCCAFLFAYMCICYRNIKTYVYMLSEVISTFTIYIILSIILAVPCSFCYSILKHFIVIEKSDNIIIIIEILASICIMFFQDKVQIYKVFKNKGIRWVITAIGLFLIIIRQIGIYLYDEGKQLHLSFLVSNILIFVMIFGILWLIDHYRLSKGKLKAEQDSSRMNADLHRSKELMPLLLSVVNENQGLLDPQIVEEFQRIYAEQMIVGKRENMNYKLMGTTGITLLDSHLQHYIMECARKNIVMDVFVSEPIVHDMQELKIAQLQMHNIMGDMIRNAIRAIERENKTDGKVLVIIGKKETGMEIVVYDNGQMIPELVLEKFGERGVTTGGTGNGLADLMNLLDTYDGSLVIEEKDASSSAYTKGIHLVFDGKCRRELYTVRVLSKKIYENGFWTKIENVENG